MIGCPILYNANKRTILDICEVLGTMTEYESVHHLARLLQDRIITVDEHYLLLGRAIRQPERLQVRLQEFVK